MDSEITKEQSQKCSVLESIAAMRCAINKIDLMFYTDVEEKHEVIDKLIKAKNMLINAFDIKIETKGDIKE